MIARLEAEISPLLRITLRATLRRFPVWDMRGGTVPFELVIEWRKSSYAPTVSFRRIRPEGAGKTFCNRSQLQLGQAAAYNSLAVYQVANLSAVRYLLSLQWWEMVSSLPCGYQASSREALGNIYSNFSYELARKDSVSPSFCWAQLPYEVSRYILVTLLSLPPLVVISWTGMVAVYRDHRRREVTLVLRV